MFEVIIEILKFLTFSSTVEATSFSIGDSSDSLGIFSTAISLVFKKIMFILPIIIVLIVVLSAATLGMPQTGFFGTQMAQMGANRNLKKMFLGIPALAIMLGLGGAFLALFVRSIEMTATDKNNIMCVLINSKCSHNSAFNGTQVRIDSMTDTLMSLANISAGVVLAVSIIWFVFAGYTYMTEQATVGKVESAKKQMIWTGLGIFIALSAMALVRMLTTIFFA